MCSLSYWPTGEYATTAPGLGTGTIFAGPRASDGQLEASVVGQVAGDGPVLGLGAMVGQRERLAGAELPNTSLAVLLACLSSFSASALASASPLGVSSMTLSSASFSCSPPE
jgi:hypothetical protein